MAAALVSHLGDDNLFSAKCGIGETEGPFPRDAGGNFRPKTIYPSLFTRWPRGAASVSSLPAKTGRRYREIARF
jgi:hypothetical protein